MKDSCVVNSVDLFQFVDSRLSTTGLRMLRITGLRMVEVRRLKKRDNNNRFQGLRMVVEGMFQAVLEI